MSGSERPGSSNNPLTLPDTPPRASGSGSSSNPHILPDTPPRVGSAVNPFVLKSPGPPYSVDPQAGGDVPRPPRKKGVWGGPPSTILPHVRRPPPPPPPPAPSAARTPVSAENTALVPVPPLPAAGSSSSRSRPAGPPPRSVPAGSGFRAILALEASLVNSGHRAPVRSTGRSNASTRMSNTSAGAASTSQGSSDVNRRLIRTPARLADAGWRMRRSEALEHRDLWEGGRGPREQLILPGREYQQCGICQHVKSHPVSYRCGHSHCYVCIRLWLERKFTCPQCQTTMHEAPFRHYGEENGIEFDYPEWNDQSKVDYSFDGLRFPR